MLPVSLNDGNGLQQCFRVDDPRGFGWLGMPGRPEAAPLPPQEIEGSLQEALFKFGRQGIHGQ